MQAQLGLLTVGQAPRTDVVPVMRDILGPGVTVAEKGALDGATPEFIASIAPKEGEYPIVTRMADGSQTIVGKPALVPLVNGKLREFVDEGIMTVALMCTGMFPALEKPRGMFLMRAQDIVDNCIAALVDTGMVLGVLIPLESQKEHASGLYPGLAGEVVAVAASPYRGDEGIRRAAEELARCDVIVMHCMGYTRAHRDLLRAATGKPVIQSNAVVARVAAEVL